MLTRRRLLKSKAGLAEGKSTRRESGANAVKTYGSILVTAVGRVCVRVGGGGVVVECKIANLI